MKKLLSIILTITIALAFVPSAFAADGLTGLDNFTKSNTYHSGQFSDVKTGDWFYDSVKASYEYGLVKGNPDGTFNVKGNVTIAEALALACRLHNIYYGGDGVFQQGTIWFTVYVDYALNNRLIKDGEYTDYNQKATRAQFASILSAALPDEALPAINDVKRIPDVSSTASYFTKVLKLYNAGILTGSDSKGTFNPNSNIVRTEVAAIVTRMADKSLGKTVSFEDGQEMTVHFINVGQGDSIFIDFGNTEILIDASTSNYGNVVSNYIRPYTDGNLDYVIATHMDADHIGGLPTVLSNFEVGCIIDSGEYDKTTKVAQNFISAARNEGCTYTSDYNTTFNLGSGAYLDIIETGDDYSNSNDNSVVSQIRYGKFKALFTGDMSSSVEKSNINKFSDIDILKVAHHGSRESTSSSFLSETKPEVAIISAAATNTYGHPHADLLYRLISNGIKVFGTYKGGTIVVTTDGSSYSINKNIQLTITDTCDEHVADYYPVTPDPVIDNTPITNTTYIGNLNTHKFHYSWCSSVSNMAEKNKVVLSSRSAAISAGYEPCKNCNP